MHARRSELKQAVAPLFNTDRAERQKRAIPVLLAVRRLLGKGWCEGAIARDRGGHEVRLTSDRRVAVSWSLYGAPKFVTRADPLDVQFALSELRRAVAPLTLEQANNFGSQRSAVANVDKALVACGYSARGGWTIGNTSDRRPVQATRATAEGAQALRRVEAPAATPPGARRLAS